MSKVDVVLVVLLFNFEQISLFSNISIADFEQVNVNWVGDSRIEPTVYYLRWIQKLRNCSAYYFPRYEFDNYTMIDAEEAADIFSSRDGLATFDILRERHVCT